MPALSTLSAMISRSVVRAQPMAKAYAEGNMTSRVKITRPADNTFDRDTGLWTNPVDNVVVDNCPGHIATVSGGTTYNLGDEPVYYANTTCSIPLDSPRPEVNDDLEVLSCPDDSLVGRHFKVDGVDSGGMLAAFRRLSITGAEPAPNVSL